MKKILRKWLGIEKDKEDNFNQMRLLVKAINETFDLKKKDKCIGTKMMHISIREFDKGGKSVQ